MATATNYDDLLKLVNNNASSLGKLYAGYNNTYNDYANQLINNGSFQAIENARQNMTDQTNRQYNNAAKNYYAQYRINQNKLPEQLSNLGVTGGASETAQLGLMNQYSGNLYNNEQGRANALNQGNMQYDQMVADNSAKIANQLASTYLSMAQQAREQTLADEQQAYERKQAEDAKAYERALVRAQTSGDYSAMKAFGWTAAEIKKANKLAAGGGSSGGGGGGSSRRSGRRSRRSYGRYYGGGSGLYLNVGSASGSGGTSSSSKSSSSKPNTRDISYRAYNTLSEGGQMAKARQDQIFQKNLKQATNNAKGNTFKKKATSYKVAATKRTSSRYNNTNEAYVSPNAKKKTTTKASNATKRRYTK